MVDLSATTEVAQAAAIYLRYEGNIAQPGQHPRADRRPADELVIVNPIASTVARLEIRPDRPSRAFRRTRSGDRDFAFAAGLPSLPVVSGWPDGRRPSINPGRPGGTAWRSAHRRASASSSSNATTYRYTIPRWPIPATDRHVLVLVASPARLSADLPVAGGLVGPAHRRRSAARTATASCGRHPRPCSLVGPSAAINFTSTATPSIAVRQLDDPFPTPR